MTDLELLRQQKLALDSQIAEAVRLDQARKKALELQAMREREAEIIKGTAEIQALMKKYKLTKNDVFDEGKPRPTVTQTYTTPSSASPKKKTLEEMRQFYNKF